MPSIVVRRLLFDSSATNKILPLQQTVLLSIAFFVPPSAPSSLPHLNNRWCGRRKENSSTVFRPNGRGSPPKVQLDATMQLCKPNPTRLCLVRPAFQALLNCIACLPAQALTVVVVGTGRPVSLRRQRFQRCAGEWTVTAVVL